MTPPTGSAEYASVLLVLLPVRGRIDGDPLETVGGDPREEDPGEGDPREGDLREGCLWEGDLGEGDLRDENIADADILTEQLLADGHTVRLARTAAHARALARGSRSRSPSPPDLVLIQAQRRLREALDLVLEIRGSGATEGRDDANDARGDHRPARRAPPPHPWPARVPIIVIVPRRSPIDVLRAFEVGADDCLAAPLCYLELRARIRALLARCSHDFPPPIVRAGPLAIDTASRAVMLEGRRLLDLPRLQYELLLALAREPHRVIARSELTRCLWGRELPDSTRALDSHASRLRRALRAAHAERWIVGIRGVGYRLR